MLITSIVTKLSVVPLFNNSFMQGKFIHASYRTVISIAG
jgi:hypothetical protein